MKALHRSSLMLVIALAASAPLSAQTFVATGFEDPITLGDPQRPRRLDGDA